MSHAALMAKPEAPSGFRAGGPSKGPSEGLRVGPAHDSFEREADHVAETVSAGGRIPGWSLSKMSIGQVQRASVPAEHAKAKDSGLSIEAAFLQTALGRKLAHNLSGGPHSKAAEESAASLRGTVIVGPEAAAAVASLAAAKGGLPARIPEIALDRVHQGLRVHIAYAGSPEHPTQGRVSFSLAAQTRKPEGGGHPQPAPQVKPTQVKTLVKKEPGHAHADGGHPHAGAHPDHPAAHHEHAAPHEAPSKREEVAVQRKVDRSAPFVAERSTVEPVLSSPGRPLDPDTRSYMESRIGHDFSAVRVHTDSRAAQSAREMGAQAYTSGTNVVFGAGKFSPGTAEGRRLIAHELTHVVQQDKAPAKAHPVIRRAPAQIQRAPDEEGGASGAENNSPGYVRRKLNEYAKDIPGFTLFTVILGWNPIISAKVSRSPENVVHGVMGLVPIVGEETFKRVKESNAMDSALKWLETEITGLGFSLSYFKDLGAKAIDSVSLTDVADPAGAVARVVGFFRPPYERLKKFALDAVDKVLELAVEEVLRRLNGLGIMAVLKKAGATFKKIIKDPSAFLDNLLKALGQGFNQFKDHIGAHIKDALMKWLFGQIADTGIEVPKQFDLRGVVGLILQVLGLTYPRVRKRLVAVIGETPVSVAEKGVELLSAIHNEGLGAAWKMILEKAAGLVDTMKAAVRNWIVTKIVTAGIVQLIGMFNPIGGIIKAVELIYTTVTFFMEKAKELAEVGRAVVDSIAEIADGSLVKAANFVEGAMAKTILPVLDFLGRLLHLDGIGKAIRGVIEKIQERVDAALGKVIEFIVAKAKELLGKAKEGVVEAIGWWRERREIETDGEKHTVYMDGTEEAPQVMIKSDPRPWSDYFQAGKEPDGIKDKEALATIRTNAQFLMQRVVGAKATDKVTKEEVAANVEARRVKINQLANAVAKAGLTKTGTAAEKPISKINYGGTTDEGGAKSATAAILSEKHPDGTTVRDFPSIWTDIVPDRRKLYVQGHLLNRLLGGEGRRFNLTPITISANSLHEKRFESHVKRWVDTEGQVVSYSVKADYSGSHAEPAGYTKLKSRPNPDKALLKSYQTEMALARRFKIKAEVLKWNKDKTWKTDPKPDKGHQPLDDNLDTPIAP